MGLIDIHINPQINTQIFTVSWTTDTAFKIMNNWGGQLEFKLDLKKYEFQKSRLKVMISVFPYRSRLGWMYNFVQIHIANT